MRKKIAIRLAWWLPIGAVLTLVAVNHQDLNKIISIWLSGQQTSSSTLWGLSMVWWGRLGKVMQFIAGCAIVLDLVGPIRLRKVGQAAREQLHDFRAYANRVRETDSVAKLHECIEEQIIVLHAPYSDVASRWELIDSTSPLPNQQWFTAEMIDQLRTRIRSGIAQVECKCRTGRRHYEPCIEQISYTRRQVREFFLDHLPLHERELFDNQKDLVRVQVWTFLTIMPITIAAGFGVGILTKKGMLTWWWTAPIVIILITIFSLVDRNTTSTGLWIRSTIVGGIARTAARALDRSQPGHPLRWAGFFIFILGFSFDLLAS